MILRYPSLFRLFRLFRSPSSSSLSVGLTLTPAASALADRQFSLLAASLPAKLHRLLMLAPHGRLLLAKLAHLAPDLGLPRNFPSALCPRHPDRFASVDTSYGRTLQLNSWDLPSPSPDYLLRFHALPAPSPYNSASTDADDVLMAERRACAVVRELLAMMVEKRTLVDHLTHFRKDFGLRNRLRAMLLRHPEMFYVSIKGVRDSVFLVEAYDDHGFEDLFESGIGGEDWEEIYGEEGGEDDKDEGGEVEEFWVKRAAAVGLVGDGEPKDLQVW